MGHIKDRWYTGRGDNKKPSARHGTGLRWQIWYQVDGREKCGGSFKVKASAERKLIELEASLMRGQWVDPTDRTTVGEYARKMAAIRPHGRNTARSIDGFIRNHLDGTPLGSQRLATVRPSDAQAWVTARSQVLAPTTLQQLVKFVRSVFSAAAADHLIFDSPFTKLSLPRADQERVVPLSVGQVAMLADTVKPKYRAMVLTQAGLGVRMGELLALRIQDVDFLRRTVRIEDQIDKSTRERVPPKTPKSRRTLPLPDMVSTALAEHIRKFPPLVDGLIFHTSTDKPYWQEYYTHHVFNPAIKKAKLPPSTPHDLRHHYASVLLAAGESVIAVAERLGHENASLVLSTYGHLMPDSEDRTRKAIDGAWSAVSDDALTAQGRPQ